MRSKFDFRPRSKIKYDQFRLHLDLDVDLGKILILEWGKISSRTLLFKF